MAEADRAWCWSVLGRARLRLSDHIRDLDVAQEAIAALEQADALSGGAAWELRAGIWHSLATARVQHEERRLAQDGVSTSDLDRAIDLAVIDLTALAASGEAPDTDCAGWYQNVAVLVSRRMRRPGRTPAQTAADRATGLNAAAAGLGLLPAGDRGIVSLLAARADLIRLGESRAEDVGEALTAVFDAAVELTDPEIIVAGANLATHHAADARWRDVSVVGQKSQQVVEFLVRRQPRDEYRWTIIRRAAGIAAVTAHALANESRAAEAAVALERMQATELSDRYARPHQVHRLVSGLGHHDLAAEYRRAVLAVRDTEQPDHVLRSAEARLAEVTRDIEKLPGLARLLRPVDEGALSAATRDRTVVYLACGRYGGVAVVTRGDGSFRAHVLDDLTVAQVAPVATRFARRVVAPANSPRLRSRTIRNTTEWLGRFVVPQIEPIIAADSADVTLVPIGQLAGLPLHAAWTQSAGGPGWALGRRRYTFSPSAFMLRTPATPMARDARALVVADPARQATGNLHGAGSEAAAVRSAFRGRTRSTGPTRR